MEITTDLQLPIAEETFQSTLQVLKISPFYDDTALKVANLWEKVAREKALLATDPDERTQFNACANISSYIANTLQYPSDFKSYYMCKDEHGNDQGMMVTEMMYDHIYIALLVTNPNNIRSSVNEQEQNKVKGAGTTLLQKAEQLAVNEGKDSVKLFPLSSAISFYEKNGFQFTEWGMSKTVLKVQDIHKEMLIA